MARQVKAIWITTCAAMIFGCRAPYTRNLEVLKARQARADLQFAVTELHAIHPDLYHTTSQADFQLAVQHAQSRIHDPMPRRELTLVLKELLATVGDDHTFVDTSTYQYFLEAGGRTLPVRLRYDQPNRAQITSVSPNCHSPHLHIGSTLTAIDGIPIAAWTARYRQYESQENPHQRDVQVIADLPDLFWYDRGELKTFELHGVDPAGHEWTDHLPPVPGWPDDAASGTFPFTFYHGHDICLMTARSFDHLLEAEWNKAMPAMLAQMAQNHTQLLILDLRRNLGGNSGFATDLLQRIIDHPFSAGSKHWRYSRAYQLACLRWGLQQRHLPSWLYLEYFVHLENHFPGGGLDLSQLHGEWIDGDGPIQPLPGSPWHGKIAVLIDDGTYSAGVDIAAIVKDNHLGLVAGQETGGRASFYSEVAPVCLPSSGIYCLIASAHRTRPAHYDDRQGVLPDMPLPPTLPDDQAVTQLWNQLQTGNWPHK